LLNENDGMVEDDRRMLEIINQHTLRINNIIEDILKISRGSHTFREDIDLREWLPGFIDRFCQSGQAEREDFEIDFEVESAELQFDSGHLEQILSNLCTNACVHGNGARPFGIRVFADVDRPLCIEFSDRGPGIDPGILDKIFEPFYTTSHEGSGLGLYIVNQLCELNNATISAGGNRHGGTSFTLMTNPRTGSQLRGY
jgi:two-component system sensor histidine kinase PilS (NtrC family)